MVGGPLRFEGAAIVAERFGGLTVVRFVVGGGRLGASTNVESSNNSLRAGAFPKLNCLNHFPLVD